MLSLNPKRLSEKSIPVGTGWLLGSCMEARGKQDLWMRQKPEVLELLREQAIIQSVESSNRIEGVTIPANRLRSVLLGKDKPRDRSEEELAGYRQALDWIFSRKREVSIIPALIQRLHTFAQGGFSGDAGDWKKRDNEIIEILPNGVRKIRFVPTSAKDIPKTMDALCRNYREACDEERVPPLLIIAIYVFDLLCIHPFRDGNGRVSRLATTILLQSHGFQVARYVSLERLVERSKEEYYSVLAECSRGWQEGKNEIVPWWNYFLSVLRQAYKEFERQVESTEARPAKSDMVRQTILAQIEQFTLGDLSAQLPSASLQLIKKILAELKKKDRIRLIGRGRGARWEVIP
ncbi:MAG: Fic family protein [Thermodesulfobacteriota bacterium]|nr:Fic family protein [Thermodesulfobacteriota bacterium]